MVPPALAEVGQLVLQAVLQELEHHAHDCAHPPVADHQGLRPRQGRQLSAVGPPGTACPSPPHSPQVTHRQEAAQLPLQLP